MYFRPVNLILKLIISIPIAAARAKSPQGGKRRCYMGYFALSTPRPPKKHIVPDDWQERFLVSLATIPVVRYACTAARVSIQFVYNRRHSDPEFARAWSEALAIGLEVLEDEARRRAIETSDTLLIFLLKAHDPDKYRDRLDVTSMGKSIQLSWGAQDDATSDND